MIINIASHNPSKIEAFREIIKDYNNLQPATIVDVDSLSGVSEQPISLDETIKGAINRAQGSFNNCQYSVGLESGLMSVPYTKTGYMDVCACAIFDGHNYYLGLSSAWEPPAAVVYYIINDGLDMNEAALQAGLTSKKNVGSAEGLVGIMTKGKLSRKEYTKEAIRMALIHLDK